MEKVNNLDICVPQRTSKRLVTKHRRYARAHNGIRSKRDLLGKRIGSPKSEAVFSHEKAASQKDLPRRGASALTGLNQKCSKSKCFKRAAGA